MEANHALVAGARRAAPREVLEPTTRFTRMTRDTVMRWAFDIDFAVRPVR